MSTYKELHGFRVEVVSSNPSNPKEGEVWYNSTLGQLKGYVLGAGAFSSGGNMPESLSGNSGAGTQTTGLSMGGFTGTAYPGKAYEYDGSSWTAGNAEPNIKQAGAGCGVQTAALFYGGGPGGPPGLSGNYEYDGTNWTAGGSLPVGVYQPGGFGVLTAAVSVGGDRDTPPTGARYPTASNEYNGTSWTAGNSCTQAQDLKVKVVVFLKLQVYIWEALVNQVVRLLEQLRNMMELIILQEEL